VLLPATGPLRIERGVIAHDATAVSVRRSIACCINSVSGGAVALADWRTVITCNLFVQNRAYHAQIGSNPVESALSRSRS
jgi:hypothetical protein